MFLRSILRAPPWTVMVMAIAMAGSAMTGAHAAEAVTGSAPASKAANPVAAGGIVLAQRGGGGGRGGGFSGGGGGGRAIGGGGGGPRADGGPRMGPGAGPRVGGGPRMGPSAGPGYRPRPGYARPPGYRPGPGYRPAPGYRPVPGYRPRPGYRPGPGYPPRYGRPPPVYRWGHRGRRYWSGGRWYFWAPWIGTYIYFDSYEACYRRCRAEGWSRAYCRDLCSW
jgi:hypothetical protein